MRAPPERGSGRPVRAWDLPTRLFHWALVALLIAAYFTHAYTGDPALYWHRLNGYAVLTLLLFRLFWGVVGSSTAHFPAFPPDPRAALGHLRDLARPERRLYLGHNPAGTLLIYGLLAAALAQAGTGLFTSDDVMAEGPFAESGPPAVVARAAAYHAIGFWILVGLAALHITANLLYQFVRGEPIVSAMVTGRKPAAFYADQQEARIVPLWRALACLLAAAAIVFGGLALAGAPLLR